MAFRQRTLNFPPGTEHLYSNTNYNLLAEIVQRVTGRPFAAWMRERLFLPLQMTSTRVLEDHREVVPNRAYGYERGKDGRWRVTPDNLTAYGSSSIFSTVDDFARWLINFDGGKVGGPAALAAMRMPGRLADGTSTSYGSGILLGSYRGLPMFTHSGGWASFDRYDVYFPEQKFGIVVLANSEAVDAQAAVIKIADIYLAGELAPPGAGGGDDGPPPARRAVAGTASPAQLAACAGQYESEELETRFRIVVKGGALELQHPRLGNIPLTFVQGEEFASKEWFLRSIVFERGGLVVNGDSRSRNIRFVKVSPPA